MHRRSAANRVGMRLFAIHAVILWAVGTMRTVVGQGGDCSPLVGRDLGDLDSLNQSGLISAALPSQPELQLLDYHIVCVAQGTERNTWRMASGVATYMLAGGMNCTTQFHFQCENDGSAWSTTVLNSTEYVLTDTPNATFDTPIRTDCALCISPEQPSNFDAGNDQHCVSCASECNVTGLMRCTSPASTDCCTLYGPGGQCVNESMCPGNSVANEMEFECTCPPNYTGLDCTTDVNECEMDTNPCENGANCTNTDGSFVCVCPPGLTGSLCDLNITITVPTSECLNDPCMNDGTCMNNSGSVVCLCSSGYTGATCGENIDDCIPNPCQNGGECINGLDAEFICNCTENWNGTQCDVCTLENCANCTANENESFAAVCVQCEDGYQLENEICNRVCQVEGCVNCSESSSYVCEECDSGLMLAQDGSTCRSGLTTPPPPLSPSTSSSMTTSTAASSGNNTSRLAGIVVGSVVGGLLLLLLAVVTAAAIVHWRRKKSRVTLTFDLDTIKASHVSANPVFEDLRREDSGIENDDEIVVNKGALEFEDD